MVLTPVDGRTIVAEILRAQAEWCERLDSPLYAALLMRAADDAEEGGPVWHVLAGHENDPVGSALALRFMGAVHRLVLEGVVPMLAVYYPSAGGTADAEKAWPAFLDGVSAHVQALRALVQRPVQTNEVGRSAALVGGFLTIAREFDLPLRILEIGSSAGLNLRWDRYRYESGAWSWGDASSAVQFTDVFSAGLPPHAAVRVDDRMGCDPAPVNAGTEDGRLTLMSYTWPDQMHRFELLRGALEIATRVPVTVERSEAVPWLASRLADRRSGVATVVFHSIVAQYLGEGGRAGLRQVLAAAGSIATGDAPLAWLRFEPTRPEGGGRFLLHLTTWPGGDERLLAEAHPHGPPVRWLGG